MTNCSGVSSMSTTGAKSNAARAPGRPKALSNSRFISSCIVTRSRIGGPCGFQRMIAIVMPSSFGSCRLLGHRVRRGFPRPRGARSVAPVHRRPRATVGDESASRVAPIA